MKTIQPRKQRKRLFQAPLHIRYKQFSAPLSPELKASHNTRSVPVRVGDTVKIMRGDRKGFEGKVTRVDRQKYRIFVEGITREKVDGSAIQIPIHPSKVMIIRLNLDDKWRKGALKRKAKEKPVEEPIEEKPVEEKKPKAPKKRRKRKTEARKAKVKTTTKTKPAGKSGGT
ncbi:MAG: 50S ribosomal protein L24 [Candidatus Bathyarchaeota archaeon]|nr:50S ribosomal protein L24 [Candidatus Bathyarchaeota archaeon]